MVKKSSPRRPDKITSVIDDLIDLDFIPSCNEEFDLETLKLLEEYEMQSTMNSVETQTAMGQLDVGPDNTFQATFTEEGSTPIQSMSYMNDLLTVVFRSNPGTEYQYIVPVDTLTQIIDEVRSTLVEGEGSVGRLINSLIRSNTLQLV